MEDWDMVAEDKKATKSKYKGSFRKSEKALSERRKHKLESERKKKCMWLIDA
ncbi:hypothetical protein [Acinetobacter haemolyticus]|uniref:hypothetical protein n=1 Tax=Acinetobacter haemolyticus TaxID=29430 RepID=UPI001387304F|nr:hypothetical protein [Acinetobacter haemolyticus]